MLRRYFMMFLFGRTQRRHTESLVENYAQHCLYCNGFSLTYAALSDANLFGRESSRLRCWHHLRECSRCMLAVSKCHTLRKRDKMHKRERRLMGTSSICFKISFLRSIRAALEKKSLLNKENKSTNRARPGCC